MEYIGKFISCQSVFQTLLSPLKLSFVLFYYYFGKLMITYLFCFKSIVDLIFQFFQIFQNLNKRMFWLFDNELQYVD